MKIHPYLHQLFEKKTEPEKTNQSLWKAAGPSEYVVWHCAEQRGEKWGDHKGVYEVVVKEDERLLEASGCKRILNSEDYLFIYLYIFKNSDNLI